MSSLTWVVTQFTPHFSYIRGGRINPYSRNWENTHARHKFDCLTRGGIAALFSIVDKYEMRWDWD